VFRSFSLAGFDGFRVCLFLVYRNQIVRLLVDPHFSGGELRL